MSTVSIAYIQATTTSSLNVNTVWFIPYKSQVNANKTECTMKGTQRTDEELGCGHRAQKPSITMADAEVVVGEVSTDEDLLDATEDPTETSAIASFMIKGGECYATLVEEEVPECVLPFDKKEMEAADGGAAEPSNTVLQVMFAILGLLVIASVMYVFYHMYQKRP